MINSFGLKYKIFKHFVWIGWFHFISPIFHVVMVIEDELGDALPPFLGKKDEKVVDPPVGEDASKMF